MYPLTCAPVAPRRRPLTRSPPHSRSRRKEGHARNIFWHFLPPIRASSSSVEDVQADGSRTRCSTAKPEKLSVKSPVAVSRLCGLWVMASRLFD